MQRLSRCNRWPVRHPPCIRQSPNLGLPIIAQILFSSADYFFFHPLSYSSIPVSIRHSPRPRHSGTLVPSIVTAPKPISGEIGIGVSSRTRLRSAQRLRPAHHGQPAKCQGGEILGPLYELRLPTASRRPGRRNGYHTLCI
jgi:hypothetical protein